MPAPQPSTPPPAATTSSASATSSSNDNTFQGTDEAKGTDKAIRTRPGYRYCQTIEEFLHFYTRSTPSTLLGTGSPSLQPDPLTPLRPLMKTLQTHLSTLQLKMRNEEMDRIGSLGASLSHPIAQSEMMAREKHEQLQRDLRDLELRYHTEYVKLTTLQADYNATLSRVRDNYTATALAKERERSATLQTYQTQKRLAEQAVDKLCYGCLPCVGKKEKAALTTVETQLQSLGPVQGDPSFATTTAELETKYAGITTQLIALNEQHASQKFQLMVEMDLMLHRAQTGKVISQGLEDDFYTNFSIPSMLAYLATHDALFSLIEATETHLSTPQDAETNKHLHAFMTHLLSVRATLLPLFQKFYCNEADEQEATALLPLFRQLNPQEKAACLDNPERFLTSDPSDRVAAVSAAQIAVLPSLSSEVEDFFRRGSHAST